MAVLYSLCDILTRRSVATILRKERHQRLRINHSNERTQIISISSLFILSCSCVGTNWQPLLIPPAYIFLKRAQNIQYEIVNKTYITFVRTLLLVKNKNYNSSTCFRWRLCIASILFQDTTYHKFRLST